MKVVAQIEKIDPETGAAPVPAELSEVSADGPDYESARAAIVIPPGWRLIAWVVPEHLDALI